MEIHIYGEGIFNSVVIMYLMKLSCGKTSLYVWIRKNGVKRINIQLSNQFYLYLFSYLCIQ